MATLYTWTGNTDAAAVQVAAKLSNSSISTADMVPGQVPSGFPAYATNAPLLETACGQKLTQLSAILSHFGSSDASTAEWLGFAENVIKPAACAWVFPTLGAMPNNKGEVAKGKQALLSALSALNDILASKTFLVGNRVSIADAAVVASLNLAFKQVLAPEYQKNIPHVCRWYKTCVNQPSFKAFDSSIASKEAQFDGATFGALNKKGGDNRKKSNEKQPKKKADKKSCRS